jgi:hypothetical protein
MTVIMAWPLKRSAFARMQKIAAGTVPAPGGAELLVSTTDRPVQVELYLPAEPDRICVFGTPLSASRREFTGETARGAWANNMIAVGQVETVRLEVRVRVYEPGEDFESVDKTLGDMCSAVATAVLTAPLFEQGRIYLSGVSQDPTALAPSPEPSVTGNASLVFTAEVITW